MGFAGYFLVVWDFIHSARQHGIAVGPGRGSSAGSLVAYCLGITTIDPMSYGLLYERFLYPERIYMPDMDIDFADDRRDEVIRYVADKYGRDRVAHIIFFFSSRRRHTRFDCDWSSDVCSSDLGVLPAPWRLPPPHEGPQPQVRHALAGSCGTRAPAPSRRRQCGSSRS